MIYFTGSSSIAQLEGRAPSYFNQNLTYYNVADVNTSGETRANIQYLSYPGPRRVFRSVFTNFITNISEQINAGIQVHSDIQQGFSNFSTFNFMGGYTLFDTKDRAFHVGGSIGILNFNLLATPFTPGFSHWDINFDYGMIYHIKSHQFGASLFNILNPQVEVFNSSQQLPLGIRLLYSLENSFQPQLESKHTSILTYEENNNIRWQLLNDIYYSALVITAGIETNPGNMLFGAGIKDLNLTTHTTYTLNLIYAENISPLRGSFTGRYEINLSLKFK